MTGGEHHADMPLAGRSGRVQLGVGQQLVAGVIAVEIAGDPGEVTWAAVRSGRAVEAGPRR